MNATRHGALDRLLQAWLVPRCTRVSPARSRVSSSSIRAQISPESTSAKSTVSVLCMPGCREASGSIAWWAPIAPKAAFRSKPPGAWSGGNSTTLKMAPLRGGSSTTGRAAASAAPALEAGAPSVTHRFVSAKSGRPGIVSTCGDGPSLTKIERPRASWPVTTRRIGLIMAGLYTGGESPWPIS
jgi:hypothetical protein